MSRDTLKNLFKFMFYILAEDFDLETIKETFLDSYESRLLEKEQLKKRR